MQNSWVSRDLFGKKERKITEKEICFYIPLKSIKAVELHRRCCSAAMGGFQ